MLERASARETALRVAVGGLAKLLLRELGITVFGYVRELGGIAAPPLSFDLAIRDASPVYTLNPEADPAIVAAIDAAREAGDTLGGVVETIVTGCPIGLGSHAQWDRKLDARLACRRHEHPGDQGRRDRPGRRGRPAAGLEGDGPDRLRGRTIRADDRRFGFRRPTNNAGGIEGGTSNGEPIVVRAAKKPISTLAARGPSVNMATKAPQPAAYERSDVCAVPGRQRDRRKRRRLRDRRGRRREVRRHQPRGDPARAMAALHELNRERLAHWGDPPGDGR